MFRSERARRATSELGSALAGSLGALEAAASFSSRRSAALAALLRAAELECALADAGAPGQPDAERITTRVAEALWAAQPASGASSDRPSDENPRALLDRALHGAPELLDVATPEGFAYYAVHPLDVAAAALSAVPSARPVAVVGIRSIGAALGAAALAALCAYGVPCERTTVRPTGHPFNRRTELGPAQRDWVRSWAAAGATFLIVDEGPGLSGSSFLSVADTLAAAGVERTRIHTLGTRLADPARLVATDAERRWRSLETHWTGPPRQVPSEVKRDLSAGAWRDVLVPSRSERPASWTSFERLKLVSSDGRALYKFEGLAHYGETVRRRAETLAELGLGPRVGAAPADGFVAYTFPAGVPLSVRDLDSEVIRAMASACADRARVFAVTNVDSSPLDEMLRVNTAELLGDVVAIAPLRVERPVIADGVMMPHEWLRRPDGRLMKVDGAAHGDDHLLPGPTDVAWDLAGAIVEWQLDQGARTELIELYRARSGDDPRSRLAGYLAAYAAFRAGFVSLAASALAGTPEEPLLLARRRLYQSALRDATRSL